MQKIYLDSNFDVNFTKQLVQSINMQIYDFDVNYTNQWLQTIKNKNYYFVKNLTKRKAQKIQARYFDVYFTK